MEHPFQQYQRVWTVTGALAILIVTVLGYLALLLIGVGGVANFLKHELGSGVNLLPILIMLVWGGVIWHRQELLPLLLMRVIGLCTAVVLAGMLVAAGELAIGGTTRDLAFWAPPVIAAGLLEVAIAALAISVSLLLVWVLGLNEAEWISLFRFCALMIRLGSAYARAAWNKIRRATTPSTPRSGGRVVTNFRNGLRVMFGKSVESGDVRKNVVTPAASAERASGGLAAFAASLREESPTPPTSLTDSPDDESIPPNSEDEFGDAPEDELEDEFGDEIGDEIEEEVEDEFEDAPEDDPAPPPVQRVAPVAMPIRHRDYGHEPIDPDAIFAGLPSVGAESAPVSPPAEPTPVPPPPPPAGDEELDDEHGDELGDEPDDEHGDAGELAYEDLYQPLGTPSLGVAAPSVDVEESMANADEDDFAVDGDDEDGDDGDADDHAWEDEQQDDVPPLTVSAPTPAPTSANAVDVAEYAPDEDEFDPLPPLPGDISDTSVALEMPIGSPESDDERIERPQLAVSGPIILPTLDLLEVMPTGNTESDDERNERLRLAARQLEQVFSDYGVKGRIIRALPGPVVTMYELEPAPGIKSSRIINLAEDVARAMRAENVRISVVRGSTVMGVELPNEVRETVSLRNLLDAPEFASTEAELPLVLGRNISGDPVIADLAKMPHLLIAGSTGTGKSVGLNAMIVSLLFRHPPSKCRFVMIDPKMLELSVYADIPHLLTPVVTEHEKAVFALRWVVREMEFRYRVMAQTGVRNIDGYNARLARGEPQPDIANDDQPFPYVVVVVDEMADLMKVAGKDVEILIQRLAQMARAAGIHIIMATQRPSVDVVTGTIKANFPTRISYTVTSRIDSRTILGEQGAETLLGRGDMLFMSGGAKIDRVHGPFTTDEDVGRVCDYLRTQGPANYVEGVTEEERRMVAEATSAEATSELIIGRESEDDMYEKAIQVVQRDGRASISFVQRHLQIGYNRAARLVERMEKDGVVTPPNAAGKREVL